MTCGIRHNMVNGLMNVVYNANCQSITQIFCRPILFRCRYCIGQYSANCLTSPDFHLFFFQPFLNDRESFFGDSFVYQYCFNGITNRRTGRFRIKNNISRHSNICRFIYIYMAVAGTCFNYRNLCILHHRFD